MPFQIGNITIASKPKHDEIGEKAICSNCMQECETTSINDSFDDSFGNVECWSIGSDCCGAEVFQGKIYCSRTAIHNARKNHYRNNRLIVEKGQKYRLFFAKGYYIDDNGKHHGIMNITKRVIC